MSVAPARRLVGAVGALTLCSLAVAAWPWLAPVLAAAALALLVLVLWDALLLRRTPSVTYSRRLPERAFVGREAALVLCLHNPGARAARVDVYEELPRSLAATDPILRGIVIPARAVREERFSVRPRQRGDALLGAAAVLEHSALGLLVRRRLHGAGDRLRVHPDTGRYLRPEALDPRRVLAAIGVRPQRRRGEGLEFESLRDWVPGDDPRRMDWAASARRGRPVVRLHQHEKSHTLILAVDASRLMAARVAGRSKLDFAVDAALALAWTALASGDRVGLVVFDAELRARLAPRGRRADLGDFIETLRCIQPRLVEAETDTLVRHLALQRQQRALVVLLTDFVEAEPARLAPLVALARRHQVLLVALRDPIFDALAAAAPASRDALEPHGLERRIVLDDLLREREATLLSLRRAGLQTLDLPPDSVTPAILNRYLALRASGGG
jgi:uncharacterized protein (DUF58 family)